MHKTLFFKRDVMMGYGDIHYPNSEYDEYWWTYPGANDPLAPDTKADPFAAVRQGNGLINKFFMMVKTPPGEKWTAAKRKRNLVDILGTDWTVDANEALTGESGATFGGVTYTGKFAFLRDSLCGDGRKSATQRRSWERQFADVKNRLAGKTWKISTQDDRWFYREGRVEVQDTSKGTAGEITLTADCDPWKYEKYSSQDLWEWDDLDFECGIIRERDDYTAVLTPNEVKSIAIVPLEKPEKVWLSVSSSEVTGNKVFCYWDGAATGVVYNNLLSNWLETTFVPSAEHYVLKIQNQAAHNMTVKVLYRGAMR